MPSDLAVVHIAYVLQKLLPPPPPLFQSDLAKQKLRDSTAIFFLWSEIFFYTTYCNKNYMTFSKNELHNWTISLHTSCIFHQCIKH